ncbi:Maf family protein [Gordonia sp. ABSL1-1]|uniref:Maf family protein n=1 Tax=Gordonia sp. ABSL1-1 TaxID=3053923 RepID=UPI0025733228|nr:Maf family protein [Gordonia sp. ABSL1-1]MDL9937097.1 Maf family protein [Gordonia sp. ABSL1-1]
MHTPVFVLGSRSPARLRILQAAGVQPLVRVSDVDEDAVLAALPAGTDPADAVTALARAKAEAIAALPDVAALAGHVAAPAGADAPRPVVVIGCDSMLSLDGALLGKPHTAERALAQWQSMRGGQATLLTGHHLIRLDTAPPRTAAGASGTTIRFADVPDTVIERYVATGEPLQVAGAFTLDGLGGWLIDGIDGDPSSVIGIGLPLVRSLVERVGLQIADFWTG